MSRVKRAAAADIGSLLQASNFDGSTPSSDPSLPLESTMMRLPLDQIQPYDRNPRKSQNQYFEEIVESILDKGGVTATISVTKRPGEDHFIVAAGGNTRLLAQKEAYRRTQREDLAVMSVMFVPYVREINLLVDHLIENDLRSDNTFIEKALALKEIMNLVQADQNIGDLSQRKWIELLKTDYQYLVSRTVFIAYQYATEKLITAIPNALYAGMGKPKVEAIKRLESRYESFTRHEGLEPTATTILFQQSLSDCDTEGEFQIEELESTYFRQLGEMLGGRTESDLLTALELFELGDQEGAAQLPDEVQSNLMDYETPLPINEPGFADQPEQEERFEGDAPGSASTQSLTTPDNVTDGFDESEFSAPQDLTLSELRMEAIKQVKAIARCYHMDALVKYVGFGYGFFIDLPDMEANEHQSTAWWLLTTLSGLFDDHEAHSQLPDNSVIKQILIRSTSDDDFFTQIHPLVGEPEFGHLGEFQTSEAFPVGDYANLLDAIRVLRMQPASSLWTVEG